MVSIHAAEELDEDNFTILDRENIILTGEIIERQRDRQTREVKCVVRGFALDDLEGEPIVKIGPTGRLVVITVSDRANSRRGPRTQRALGVEPAESFWMPDWRVPMEPR